MNEYFKLIITDIKKLWDNLELPQKLTVSALAMLGVVAAVFFITKSTEPNWSVLYSDLNSQDIAAISESLKKSGNAYKLSDDKKAILVPANKIEELRMHVAENDLIQDSSPGFELLDNLQLGSTDFKNKLTKQRIFQGELTRSIEKINGITKARVQLAEPERSVFSDSDEEPSASVVLVLEPGFKMKAATVTAVKNLVAYSVPRLSADRVFLTDQYGNMLSEDVSKNSNDMQSFKAGFEKDAGKKITETLETIMGKDNVSVQVSADLDFNSTRATIESYVPSNQNGQGIAITSQSEKEIYKNPKTGETTVKTTGSTGSTMNSDVPTPQGQENPTEPPVLNQTDNPVASPTATAQKTAASGRDLSYEKEKSAVNYAVTKEIKQVVYAPGSVRRMTVAVAVNKILTVEEKAEIESLVAAAAGMNLERGDVVNVTSLKFTNDDASDAEQQAALEKQQLINNILDIVFAKLAPLLVFLTLGIMAISNISKLMQRGTGVVGSQQYSDDFDYAPEPYLPTREERMAEITLDMPEAFDEVTDKKKLDIQDVIMADPAEAARLLTSYIRE